MSVDDLVSRIFDELGKIGQLNNTLAFFISDNGLMWGEHGLTGGKGVPYTPSVKVPMLARWPGHIPTGSIDPRFVANIDISPTILAATGVAPNPAKPLDGRNLLDRNWKRNRMLLEFWCSNKGCNRWASTRSRHLQYTEYYDESGAITFRELYRNDPWQLDNVLADGDPSNDPTPGKLERLHRRLTHDRTCVADSCP
jgi:arylsulfatase A-like enzyme